MPSNHKVYSPYPFDVNASAAFAQKVLCRVHVDIVALIGTVRTWFSLPPDQQIQTKDLDLAVRQEDNVWIEKALREMHIKFGQIEFGGVKVELPNGINVDFVDRRASVESLYRQALIEAKKANDRVCLGKLSVLLAPLEYLIAMKLVPARERDDLILLHLLEFAEFDYEKARNIVVQYLGEASANRLDSFARRAGRRSS